MSEAEGGQVRDRIDLVLPVHNEAGAIAGLVDEWLSEANRLGVDLRIIACEDGSTDGTQDVLRRLAESEPLRLVLAVERKGYSQAVVDGLRASEAEWVCCADSDGQCDPADLGSLLALRKDGTVVVGVRTNRRDPLVRRLMSALMKAAFVALHGIHLEDPSSPYCLMPRNTAHAVTGSNPELPQGYWWEFHIRRRHLGIDVVEVPVGHRLRSEGKSRVYGARQVPGIAAVHLRGLWRLRRVCPPR